MAISHVASTGVLTSATAQGATSVSVAYVGVAAGRLAILFVAVKLDTATFADPAGWISMGWGPGGTGASANDAGKTSCGVWVRQLDGAESGSVTVTNTGGVSSAGAMSVYESGSGLWGPPVDVANVIANGASDATHGANSSAVGFSWSNSGLQPGDMVVWGFSNDTDADKALTSPTISQSGITFGTVTHRNQTLSTTGTDSGVNSFDALVSSGSGGTAPTVGFTSAVSTCGGYLHIALREGVSRSLVTRRRRTREGELLQV